MMQIFSSNKTKLIAVAFLASFVTVLVFLPTLQNGFVNWDDDLYVYENQYIKALDSRFFEWMFSFQDTMWVPLTRLSHALNYALWGLEPMGHHLTNNIFHGLNTFLVVIVIFRLMTYINGWETQSGRVGAVYVKRALITAGLTGILFGIHPMRVESVAWVTERKDVLSAFFVLLSLLYYFRFIAPSMKDKKSKNYFFSLLFFVMALMSKPMVVTFPLVIIILDIYPLERLRSDIDLKSQWMVLAEKVPYFALSLVSAVVTMLTYEHRGVEVMRSQVALSDRLLVSIKSICFYLYKMVWPVDLAPVYPYPKEISLTSPEYAVSLALVLGITTFCFYTWKRQRVWSVVWAYYIVTLLPVVGIVKFAVFGAADRYTYLPCIGVFFLIGLGAGMIYEKGVYDAERAFSMKKLLPVPVIIVILVFSSLTVRQTKVWKDSISLWDKQLELYSVPLAYNNRGIIYLNSEQYDRAIVDFNKAIEIEPLFVNAYSNLGKVYFKKGLIDDSIFYFKYAISLDPGHAEAHYNLGIAYGEKGMNDLAFREMRIGMSLAADKN